MKNILSPIPSLPGLGGAPAPIPSLPGLGGAPAPPPLPGALPLLGSAPLPNLPNLPGLASSPGLPQLGAAGGGGAKAAAQSKKKRWNPKTEMKALHWTPIKDRDLNKAKDNIWTTIDDHGFDLDTEMLETIKKKKAGGKGKGKGDKPQTITFIENDRRAQNMNIGLGTIKESYTNIREWMLEMNEEKLPIGTLKKFIALVPTEEEQKQTLEAIKKHNLDVEKNKVELLGMAEKFWYHMISIPRVDERLKLWAFKMEFDEMYELQAKRVNLLVDAHEQLKRSDTLRKILTVILAVGNYMNANNKKGEANGVRLDVLAKIEGLRSNEGGWSLLMYVYNLMANKYPDFVDLHSDISVVPDAAKVCKKEELEDLQKQVEDINNQVKDMIQKMEKETTPSEEKTESKTENGDGKSKDRFLDIMKTFAQEAQKSAERLQMKLNKSLENLSALAVAFGENKDIPLEDFMKYFTDFLEAWGKSREALRKMEAEKKKKEKMEAKKTKLQEKLEKRESKQALQDKGVLKSKKKEKQEKQQKQLLQNILNKEILQKKKKILELEGKEKKLKLDNRHRSIFVQHIQYRCLHCEELHDDAMQRTGQYLHKCWVTQQAKQERDEMKGKQLRWFSMLDKMEDCQWDHDGPCIEQRKSDNAILAGIQVVRNEENQRKRGDDGSSNKEQGGSFNTLSKLRKEKAGSGGTVHSLWERSRSGKIETASGTEVATKQDFRNVQKGFISWRRQFDPESAAGLDMKITPLLEEEETPESPPQAVDQTSKSSPKAGDPKNAAPPSEEEPNAGDSSQMNQYRKKRKNRQKKAKKSNKTFSISVENESGDTQMVVNQGDLSAISTLPLESQQQLGATLGSKSTAGHRARESKFIPGSTLEESRRLKRRGSDATSPQHNKRRSTIENNVHAETFKVTTEQKERLEDSDFLKQLRDEFINFGQLSYDLRKNTLAVVLRAQKDRMEAIELLEKKLGRLIDDTKEETRTETDNSGGDIRKFILHEEQLEMLHDEEYMTQIVNDFDHFGTINVHESELILQCRDKTKLTDAIRRLEKRLGVLWTRKEIQEIMNTLHVSWDDDDNKMIKFLDKMTKQVQKGARFNKHRKKGGPQHRWVLVRFGRLYWKERVTDKNNKSHSFNLTKIRQVLAGKVTRALQEAKDAPDRACFCVAGESVTLDLQAETEEVANEWVNYLKGYVRHYERQGGKEEKEKEKKKREDEKKASSDHKHVQQMRTQKRIKQVHYFSVFHLIFVFFYRCEDLFF
ncbi:disheveled-associated activator of morphogenesis 1 [Reticulomyxa filosa]|uniref:Disheveled-associated activator of morphogenesis 1 n=1 Tax=Reticulomyxa filosa TaxID=46433 RepID=X6MXA3_RETFI|nr:disheveled-associated activator of morphogenesis 1 [Reticulomyxa filosa]|eukprot:ETO18261.1 disheveled-associated activator of morphogenesis 1 [Reticulomyxa filosa]